MVGMVGVGLPIPHMFRIFELPLQFGEFLTAGGGQGLDTAFGITGCLSCLWVSGDVDYIADPFKLSTLSETGCDLVATHSDSVGNFGSCLVTIGLEKLHDSVALRAELDSIRWRSSCLL